MENPYSKKSDSGGFKTQEAAVLSARALDGDEERRLAEIERQVEELQVQMNAEKAEAPALEAMRSRALVSVLEYFWDGDHDSFVKMNLSLHPSIFLRKFLFGRTALHLFAENGDLKFLAEAGRAMHPEVLSVALNQRDEQGDTPLSLACVFGTRLLRRAESPSFEALNAHRTKVVSFLLEKGALWRKAIKKGSNNPLHWAIFHADANMAERVFREIKDLAVMKNEASITPFEIAFKYPYENEAKQKEAQRIVKMLCGQYVDFLCGEKRDSEPGVPELKEIHQNKDRKASEIGFSRSQLPGANQVFPPLAKSPSIDMEMGGKFRVVDETKPRHLKSAGTKLLQIFLGICPYIDDVSCARKILSEFTVSPFANAFDGYSPYHHAVISGNLPILRLFLESEYEYSNSRRPFILGSILDLQGAEGNTPLHLAYRARNTKVVGYLRSRGLSSHIFNERSQRPDEVANFHPAPSLADRHRSLGSQSIAEFARGFCGRRAVSFAQVFIVNADKDDERSSLVRNQLDRIDGLRVRSLRPFIEAKNSLFRFVLVVSPSDEQLNNWAEQQKLQIFNQRRNYLAAFTCKDASEFELFRDFHKYRMLSHALESEFSASDFMSKGILEDHLPLQDEERAKLIRETWSEEKFDFVLHPFKSFASLGDSSPFNAVAFYFGCDQALSLSFLSTYISFLCLLCLPALAYIGFMVYKMEIDTKFLPIFCIFITVVMSVNIEKWRNREHELAFIWNLSRGSRNDLPRREFYGHYQVDEVSGKIIKEDWVSNFIREWSVNLPIIILGVALVILSFWFFTWLTGKVKTFEYGNILVIVVNAINAASNLILTKLYEFASTKTLKYQNHKFQRQLENSLIVKLCVFKFAINFTNLFYYILVKDDFQLFSSSYISVLVVNDLAFVFSKHILPRLLFWLKKGNLSKRFEVFRETKVQALLERPEFRKATVKELSEAQFEELESLLERVDLTRSIEFSLIRPAPFNLRESWIHKVLQFALVLLFSPAFPPAIIWVTLFNYVDINLTMNSLGTFYARRECIEVRNIGAWNGVFVILSHLAIIVHGLILSGTSKSIFLLLEWDFDDLSRRYDVLVIVVVSGIILFSYKLLTDFVIEDVPSWVSRAILLQKNRKANDHLKFVKAQEERLRRQAKRKIKLNPEDG